MGYDLDILCATISNRYVRAKLSPPVRLPQAAKYWTDLPINEILDVLERHFDEHRRLYTCGSADGLFWMVERDMRNALEAKHPRAQVEEPEQPRRKRRVLKVHDASGVPDVIVDDPRADRLLRDRGQASRVERSSILRGYEESGEGFSADLED